MERTWARLRRLDAERPWVLDVALAVALLLASALAVSAPAPERREPDAALYGLLVLGAAPYALRRRAPVAVLVAASLPVLAIIGLGYSSAVIGSGLFLAAYTVAAACTARTTALTAGYVAVVLLAVVAVAPRTMSFGELATNAALFVGAFTLGRSARTRRENVALLLERAALAESARAEQARAAVTQERLRIARELHDVVAHSLGVIAVQAGVGAHVFEADPAEAKASLVAVSETSRAALAEIRLMVGALRDTGDASRGPRPGLAAVEELVAELGAAGLRVEVSVTGRPHGVPAAVDLAAYRLVQESLTNVLRHAGTAHAEVTIGYEPGAVVLEVLDDGHGPTPGAAAGGLGLLGMRERVAVWGGTFAAGPRPGGGFRVAARLPFGDDES